MDYEEKYKEALERAREWYDNPNSSSIGKSYLYAVFPELKENEDERMRNIAIYACKYMVDNFENSTKQYEDAIAWLEKQKPTESLSAQEAMDIAVAKCFEQGEQMKTPEESLDISSDKWNGIVDRCLFDGPKGKTAMEAIKEEKVDNAIKVESKSKFHEGDWIVYKNEVCQLVKREEGCNKLVTVFGIEKELVNERNLSTARLWTIQDAKDGDVLIASDESIFIYSGSTYRYAKFYVALTKYGRLNIDGGNWEYKNCVLHPATKEQHELLFQKMREEGYEWDEDKKELRKIEHKTIENKSEIIRKALLKYFGKSGTQFWFDRNIKYRDVISWLEKQGEQNDKIIKGKNYFCVKSHNYAGVAWIKGTKYYASDNYTLVNQGCEYYCPKYSKEEHNNLFEEVKYDCCVKKQCEQKKLLNGEDYGIDGLYHAIEILERTIGLVEGYQSDDGILEHQIAIDTLKSIYNKPKWTEEDECYMSECISAIATKDGWSFEEKGKTKHWLKSLKQRMKE